MNPRSKHHIIFVHGRGPKPGKGDLQALWGEALAAGISRDAPEQLDTLGQAEVHMVYYADHLQDFAEPGFDAVLDLNNRRQALQELAEASKAKDFRRKHYEVLPGKTPLKEFAMDMSAALGLGKVAIRQAMPELHNYWQAEADWAAGVREELTQLLSRLMTDDSNILLVSHCMGSVVAWDSLWQLTHEQPPEAAPLRRITRWITLGSPLGARAVQGMLAGNGESAERRFPAVLNAWHNIAAEDDYVCHDKTVSDDFKDMLQQRLIGDIRDHTIYNLAVRYGRSNPHSSVGYLIHPRMSQLLADWLE